MNHEDQENESDREQGTDEANPKSRSSAAEDVPAGGAGADSGAADVVRVDPEDDAEIANRSSMNDEPGVGTRGPDDNMDPSEE